MTPDTTHGQRGAATASTEAMGRTEREDCLQLDSALEREWLETNGLGAYASSTSLLCPTRRYHGLLVAPPPGLETNQRHVFLARLEESVHRTDRSFAISNARYGETWHPTGYSAIESFEFVPYPSWRYRIGRAEVRREILLVEGAHTVLVRYHLTSDRDDVELRLRPLLAFREADALTFENLGLRPRVDRAPGGIRCRPYASLPEMLVVVGGGRSEFEADPVWYRGIEYLADLARGYDGHEDHFSPGWFSVAFRPGRDIVLAATLEEGVDDPVALWEEESSRRRRSPVAVGGVGPHERLKAAADAFLQRLPSGRTGVVAGYPWFGEWGRDTCLSLPGLLLARGRVEQCGDALEALVPFLRDGLLPNVFGTTAEDSHYGSVDASLWFARAIRLYERAGGSRERMQDVFRAALASIVTHYVSGAPLDITCDTGGLIRAGRPDLNPTWMDAITGDGPVTPRDGCAVEVNALWYALLAHVEQLAAEAKDSASARSLGRLRRLARRSFCERFWVPDEDYLADVWRDGEVDAAVRPNMVIAAALEASPLTRGMRTDVVRRARAELLTPFGLRTLSPDHPEYRGRYQGGTEERDAAYHQGTAWPWLLGFYAEAYLRAFGFRRKRVAHVRELLDGCAGQLDEAGLGQISEVCDGDPPHLPGGAIAQAWSVAELVRAYRMLEDGRP